MITLTALLFILIVIAVIVIAALGTGVLSFILLFGDLIICIAILSAIIKALSKKHGDN